MTAHTSVHRITDRAGKWTLYRGDVLAALRQLADRSVHCVVTSPPYWGLRDYGIAPSVWGGSAGCRHRWTGYLQPAANGITHEDGMRGKTLSGRSATRKPKRSAFCSRCNAWRGCLGLEPTLELYVEHLVAIFREVGRVLRDDGTLWLNLGDTYAHAQGGRQAKAGQLRRSGQAHFDSRPIRVRRGINVGGWTTRNVATRAFPPAHADYKIKDLLGIPWRVAFALQADGWYLRSDVIWHKPNPMPESVRDRPTKAHEYLFLLTKAPRYFYDATAVQEAVAGTARPRGAGVHPKSATPGTGIRANASFESAVRSLVTTRNRRTVWTIPTQPFPEAHFATFPEKLVEPCILAGTSERGCCAKCGAPWTSVVTKRRWPTRPGRSSKAYVPDTAKKQDALGKSTYTGFNRRWRDTHMIGNRDPGRHCTSTTTTGWEPTCACKASKSRPCVVLDPFAGASTTGVVALRLSRHFLGIELSAEYCRMSRTRLRNAA